MTGAKGFGENGVTAGVFTSVTGWHPYIWRKRDTKNSSSLVITISPIIRLAGRWFGPQWKGREWPALRWRRGHTETRVSLCWLLSAYVNKLAGQYEDKEYEFLIARGSKFEITGVEINEEPIPPQTIIKMRLIVDE